MPFFFIGEVSDTVTTSIMRITACIIGLFSLLALVSSPAHAADPAPASESFALPANATIDQVLDVLDRRGKTLHDFTADVQLGETGDPAIGNTTTRTGKLWFEKKGNEGDAKLHLVLDAKIEPHGGRLMKVPDKLEYLLEDGWLTDRNYPKKTDIRRQVVKQGDKVNLLKLGEGPFPLPIGQDKNDVHANFDVTLIRPAPDDPPDTIHLQLKPKPGTKLVKRIGQLDVWVDRKLGFPTRIDTIDATGGEQRQTKLLNIAINLPGGLKPADFQLPPIDNTWQRHSEAFSE